MPDRRAESGGYGSGSFRNARSLRVEPGGHHPAAQGPGPDPGVYLTALKETTVRLSNFLDQHQVAYMVIGGMANLFWVEYPQDFVKETRLLPLRDRNSIPIDLIFGSLPYEERAIRRARGQEDVRQCLRG